MTKRYKIIIGIVGTILLLLIIGLVMIAFQAVTPPEESQPTPTLVPSPTTVKQVLFDKESEMLLLDKLINRETLAENDAAVKSRILTNLPAGKTSGVVYQSGIVRVEYILPVDEFKAQILSTSIDQAKKDAVQWFQQQGMSAQGICALPLNFYLQTNVARYLKENQIVFNLLPNECQ